MIGLIAAEHKIELPSSVELSKAAAVLSTVGTKHISRPIQKAISIFHSQTVVKGSES